MARNIFVLIVMIILISGCPTKDDQNSDPRVKRAEDYYEGPNAYPYDDEEEGEVK